MRRRDLLPLVTLAAVLTPATASAAVPSHLTATVGTARVTVDARPFRLAIRPGGRATPGHAFAGAARTGGLETVSGDRTAGGVRYAGLTYAVGADPDLRYPELAGESLNPEAINVPPRYRALAVIAATRTGGGLALTLSTDDPAHRRILVRIAPARAGLVSVRAAVTGGGVSSVAFAFASGRDEAFHGLGGIRTGTDLRGTSVTSWVIDYRYPDASTGYYAPQTSLISSRDYGAYLDGARIARWRLDSDLPDAWRVSQAGTSLRLLVTPTPPAAAMRAITTVTGRHRVPPAWSVGPTLSRTYGITADGNGVYQQKVAADVDRLTTSDLPVSAYAFEGWAALPAAFVKTEIARLAAKHIHTILYLRSFVSNDVAGTEAPQNFDEAIAKGYVATTASGAPYLVPSPFPGAQAAVIDFTNPAARAWWSRRVAALLDTGARGFMNDFGEQVLPDMHFHDGQTGVTIHNRYPVLQAQATRAAVDAWERAHPGQQAFFFQRAGYSGDPGSAAYENAQFPGDETVDWQPGTGLPSIVPDMLNRAVGGAPGFTTDIGGYAQFTSTSPVLPATSEELFLRWSQAAVFTPFFRVHNSGLSGVQMPWSYGPATLKAWSALARLHERAQPLILRLWHAFTRTGVPMERPLWLVDPASAASPRANDEWLLGDDLLVAPVLHEGQSTRPVRLPSGCWRAHGTGPRLAGARTIAVRAPLSALPWFTRCGTAPLD